MEPSLSASYLGMYALSQHISSQHLFVFDGGRLPSRMIPTVALGYSLGGDRARSA